MQLSRVKWVIFRLQPNGLGKISRPLFFLVSWVVCLDYFEGVDAE